MGETFYCDNYEEVTGRERDGTLGPANREPDDHVVVLPDEVETKIVKAPPAKATPKAKTTAEAK